MRLDDAHALPGQTQHTRDSKVPVPDLVVILRRTADEMAAGLDATDHPGERSALGIGGIRSAACH